MMLQAILNNPYRVLGVYSNSPKKEQIANKGKMQAFLRVKKSMPLPLDLKGLLPDVLRTQEAVDLADSELALSIGQIRHAQFWFINKTAIDNIAFNHLLSGNIDSAIEMWRKSTNMSSLQNLFVCYLIKEDYGVAISDCAVPLYSNFSDEFVSLIDEKVSLSVSELAEFIIETLANENINIAKIENSLTDKTWTTIIESKRVNPLLSKIESHISEAKASKGKDDRARLNAGNKLKIASKPLLSSLKAIIGESDTRYQIVADKVSQEILQCSIDYYNDTSDLDSPAKALSLCEFAKTIAIGGAAKQRCIENYEVIKKAFENMPPIEVAKEAKEIDSIFVWYRKQKKTSANGLELLQKTRDSLISIKEKVGKNHKYYLEVSSTLAIASLSYVIDEVNDAQKDDTPNPLSALLGGSKYSLYGDIFGEQERRREKARKLKFVLASAWRTILHIDLLDTTDDFKKNRYKENRKTLYSIIDGLHGFDYPDENYIIKGCASGITVNSRFFWSDSEHYSACNSKSDYETYLKNFPSGNHVADANSRIAIIKEHNKKVLKYVLIAIGLIILFVVIVSSANEMNKKSDNSSIPTNNVENSYIAPDTPNESNVEYESESENSFSIDDNSSEDSDLEDGYSNDEESDTDSDESEDDTDGQYSYE